MDSCVRRSRPPWLVAAAAESKSANVMTTVFRLFLIFCAYGGLGYVVVRVWRTIGRRGPWSNARGLTPTPRHLRPLEQWAFDFERDIIEAPAISSGQKARASDLLSQLVVPLVGHVRLCDVDRDLEQGVASVLRAQLGLHQGDYAAELWHGFLHWSRCQAGPSQEATVWDPLIAELERRLRPGQGEQ
jgi:hypothetical protein